MLYVLDAIPSPPDSEEWPTLYIRGCRGLVRRVREISAQTDGMLGYAGEWHSHPDGHGNAPSEVDRRAFAKLTTMMAPDALPAVMLIAAEQERLQWLVGRVQRAGRDQRQPLADPLDQPPRRPAKPELAPGNVVEAQAAGHLLVAQVQVRHEGKVGPQGQSFGDGRVVFAEYQSDALNGANIVGRPLPELDLGLEDNDLLGHRLLATAALVKANEAQGPVLEDAGDRGRAAHPQVLDGDRLAGGREEVVGHVAYPARTGRLTTATAPGWLRFSTLAPPGPIQITNGSGRSVLGCSIVTRNWPLFGAATRRR